MACWAVLTSSPDIFSYLPILAVGIRRSHLLICLSRFVIAATEHLHKRITRMSDRIRQLEDALAVLQASNSREQHPLLRDGLLSIDEKLEPPPTAEDEEAEEPTEAVVNAFGTMSIMDHGVSRFFGPTGGPEGLLLVSLISHSSSSSSSLTLPLPLPGRQ